MSFYEYVQLPGIINDRFFNHFWRTSNDTISEIPFVDGMLKVYLSTFEQKLLMSFRMYDFDGNGIVRREDVRLVLSYVPFKSGEDDDNESGTV